MEETSSVTAVFVVHQYGFKPTQRLPMEKCHNNNSADNKWDNKDMEIKATVNLKVTDNLKVMEMAQLSFKLMELQLSECDSLKFCLLLLLRFDDE